jgi:acyl carrier protein
MPQVRALIASVLRIDPSQVKDEDTSETLQNWDSLSSAMLASEIEIVHDITLDDSEIEHITSVRAVRELLARHGLSM